VRKFGFITVTCGGVISGHLILPDIIRLGKHQLEHSGDGLGGSVRRYNVIFRMSMEPGALSAKRIV
jgi:hypothetical protein